MALPPPRVLLLVVTLTLAGCTTPGPQAEGAQLPVPGVPLECEAFEQLAADAMLVESQDLVAGPSVDAQLTELANLQAGKFECLWQPSDAESNGMPPWLGLHVLPDASQDFASQGWAPEIWSAEPRLGSGGVVDCPADDDQCEISFLVDDYWVFLWLRMLAPADGSVLDRRQLVVTAGEGIAAALHAAGPPRAAFEPHSDALAAWVDCNELELGGTLGAAIGAPLVLRGPDDAFDTGASIGMDDVVWHRVNYKTCSWETEAAEIALDVPDYIHLEILPGGGWAGTHIPYGNASSGARTIDVMGADEAAVECRSASSGTNGCYVTAIVDNSCVGLWIYFASPQTGNEQKVAEAAMEHVVGVLTSRD